MQPKWLNDGEPDETGEITAVIENAAGQRMSTFKGKTIKEVADKVLESQANANREIARLRRPDQARQPQQLKPEDKTLSPTDRLRLANEMTDPEKVVEAVTEIVTNAQGGVKPRDMANNLASMTDEQRDNFYRTEAEAFVAANPDYYPVPQNQEKVFAALKAAGWDFTRNNIGIIFQTLYDEGQMVYWPDEPEPAAEVAAPNGQMRGSQPPPEPNPPSPTRPRSVSTGIRSRDASATPPPPRAPQKLTRADIERMPRAEYNERLRDPVFRRAVDAL
jgi:hypothetical protein